MIVAFSLALTACGSATEPAKPSAASGGWYEFEGSWNAAGSRRTIPLGAERSSSIFDLRGTMLLAGPGRPGVGFRTEVIALVDRDTGLIGRSVWTDERGDQVYSELKGEGTSAARAAMPAGADELRAAAPFGVSAAIIRYTLGMALVVIAYLQWRKRRQ